MPGEDGGDGGNGTNGGDGGMGSDIKIEVTEYDMDLLLYI